MGAEGAAVVGVDPGHAKCGVAAVSSTGEVLARAVVETDRVGLAAAAMAHTHGAEVIVLGGRTGARRVWELIHAADPALPIAQVEEHMTTLEARERYWRETPPGCLMRLLPRGMRVPPEPVDDSRANCGVVACCSGTSSPLSAPELRSASRKSRR